MCVPPLVSNIYTGVIIQVHYTIALGAWSLRGNLDYIV